VQQAAVQVFEMNNNSPENHHGNGQSLDFCSKIAARMLQQITPHAP
jgi:hypothetical protein